MRRDFFLIFFAVFPPHGLIISHHHIIPPHIHTHHHRVHLATATCCLPPTTPLCKDTASSRHAFYAHSGGDHSHPHFSGSYPILIVSQLLGTQPIPSRL